MSILLPLYQEMVAFASAEQAKANAAKSPTERLRHEAAADAYRGAAIHVYRCANYRTQCKLDRIMRSDRARKREGKARVISHPISNTLRSANDCAPAPVCAS